MIMQTNSMNLVWMRLSCLTNVQRYILTAQRDKATDNGSIGGGQARIHHDKKKLSEDETYCCSAQYVDSRLHKSKHTALERPPKSDSKQAQQATTSLTCQGCANIQLFCELW
ncbi:MAG: hypothetical protein EAZ92_12445 [Candidatus Kapaibacterium sp.]|nr:MAG: hypothetical protein EAZ92_12445 [Candidatus Kapabacteria bacterium]